MDRWADRIGLLATVLVGALLAGWLLCAWAAVAMG
jgi:hypothetical protein